MEKKGYKRLYFIALIVLIILLIHIEIIISKKYAPENILIRVVDSNGNPEINASCKADIISKEVSFDDKPLDELASLYDFVDSSIYYNPSGSKGYYLLDTGFVKYLGDYKISVVCISQGNKGVSYTIIDSKNKTSLCEFKQDGKLLVC